MRLCNDLVSIGSSVCSGKQFGCLRQERLRNARALTQSHTGASSRIALELSRRSRIESHTFVALLNFSHIAVLCTCDRFDVFLASNAGALTLLVFLSPT